MYPVNDFFYLDFFRWLGCTFLGWAQAVPGLGGWDHAVPGLGGWAHGLLRRNVSGGTFSAGVHYRPAWF